MMGNFERVCLISLLSPLTLVLFCCQAISDYTVAEAIGFQNLPFLLMEKGSTLRVMGRSEEARDIFIRAMDEFTSEIVGPSS
jgi:hypothetical protein